MFVTEALKHVFIWGWFYLFFLLLLGWLAGKRWGNIPDAEGKFITSLRLLKWASWVFALPVVYAMLLNASGSGDTWPYFLMVLVALGGVPGIMATIGYSPDRDR